MNTPRHPTNHNRMVSYHKADEYRLRSWPPHRHRAAVLGDAEHRSVPILRVHLRYCETTSDARGHAGLISANAGKSHDIGDGWRSPSRWSQTTRPGRVSTRARHRGRIVRALSWPWAPDRSLMDRLFGAAPIPPRARRRGPRHRRILGTSRLPIGGETVRFRATPVKWRTNEPRLCSSCYER